MRRKNVTPIFLNRPKQTITGSGDILSTVSSVELAPSQDRETYNLPDGSVNGQVLNITNTSGEGYSASILVSNSFLSQHSTVTAAAGAVATLLWTGTLWVLINNTSGLEAAGSPVPENALWFTYESPFGVNADPNASDEAVQSDSFRDYVFALESSGGQSASDPDSKLWVFDIRADVDNPPGFSWTPPSSDVPDFKNLNEIIINEDDIFLVYYWRNPSKDSDGTYDDSNPSRMVKFSGVSIDFAGSNITYSSAEVVEITRGVAVHGITKDSTHIYMSQRGMVFGAGSNDLAIFRAPLSGPLTVDRFEVIDGGPKPDGTQYEWYGTLRTGGYDDYEGTDFVGSDDIKSHGDYIYVNCDAHLVNGDKDLFLDDKGYNYWRSGVGRIPKSNLSAPIEIVFIHDQGGITGGLETYNNVLTTKGDYLFSAQGSRTSRGMLAKVDLTNPTQYKSIDRPGRGGPHSIEVWGDKLVITNMSSNSQQYPYISIVRQSDLSEVAFLSFQNYLGLTSPQQTAVTDDIAIAGDYAYLAMEIGGTNTTSPTFLSVDLNNLTDSGVTTIQDFSQMPFGATWTGMIV